ncbi:hypothetical protein BUALT_Bualt12G0074400 [Buddleja alternifolia]|uniref:signal-recognition-particle GTPase n=1 Tax=Buddleja alternifolia TaxID=168488 RepID=A0AAV6WW25_9LAMI|nr:hypothetical protein BUALT_Bualt12G0074400 [Buddleja alternifolia]
MVLAQLGGSISHALQQMSNAAIIDEKVLNDCLNEITRALLQADVQFKLVRDMQTNIKKIVNLDDLAAGNNKRKIIQQDRGKQRRVQNMHITTRRRDGNLLCYTESDPVRIVVEGVERFKKENCDLIIVDTSGPHKQEAALFEEMRQVSEATKPDLVIFVMDSSIGQAAFDQAQAFKQSVAVGAMIVTKMDGHAKGGGALSAVAATKSPVIFIGTGEHMDEFEVFNVKPFVSRLLVLLQKLSEGTFTLMNFLKMGSIVQAISMLPGSRQELMRKELDSSNLKNESRIMRIARGCGRPVRDVMEMLETYKTTAKTRKRLEISKKGDMNAQNMRNVLPPDMLRQFGGMGGLQNLMKKMCGGALRI